MTQPTFHPQARRELDEAVDYLADRSTDLARRSLTQAQRTIDLLVAYPDMGAAIGRTSRRFPIRPFQYDLIYFAPGDQIHIIAIAHHRRRPGFWRDRV